MPKQANRKRGTKKSVSRKAVGKTVRKKAAPKKTAKKKAAAKKKTLRKKAVRKPAKKKTTAKTSTRARAVRAAAQVVEPGPPPGNIPSVEEPISNEEAVGSVTHYYSHLNVAVVQLNKGQLAVGDTIHVKGHTTDVSQHVESMEFEHQHVDRAAAGQSVGIKMNDPVREHDIVYRTR